MNAQYIFSAAWAKIWTNKDQFLRINVVWFLIITILSLPLLLWPQISDSSIKSPRTLPAALIEPLFYIPYALMITFALVIGTVVTAIAWHRFVVKEEQENGWLIMGGNWAFNRYFWTGLLLFFAGLVLSIFVESAVSTIVDINLGDGSLIALFLPSFCVVLPIHVFGLVLPGIATDRQISFGKSLKLTMPYLGQILLLTGLIALVFSVPDWLISTFVGPTHFIEPSLLGWLAFVLFSVVSWVAMILTFGVLSELFLKLVNETDQDSSVD